MRKEYISSKASVDGLSTRRPYHTNGRRMDGQNATKECNKKKRIAGRLGCPETQPKIDLRRLVAGSARVDTLHATADRLSPEVAARWRDGQYAGRNPVGRDRWPESTAFSAGFGDRAQPCKPRHSNQCSLRHSSRNLPWLHPTRSRVMARVTHLTCPAHLALRRET